MALTLRRWIGLLGLCCAAAFATFEKTWTDPGQDTLRARARRVDGQLREELTVLRARLGAVEAEKGSRTARDQGLATFFSEHSSENEIAAAPPYVDCDVRKVDPGSGVFAGVLSPESCLFAFGGGVRSEVFEVDLRRSSWLRVALTPADRGEGEPWRLTLLDSNDTGLANRSSALRVMPSLLIAEWLEAGTYRIIVSRSYFGGGPFELGFAVVDRSDLPIIQQETQTGGGRTSGVRPWGRIPPLESPVYWVDGIGSAYQAGDWVTLPRVLRSRDGEAIVAGVLRDSVVVTPLPGAVLGLLSTGGSVSGQLESHGTPAIWDVAVPDSTHLAVTVEAESRVLTQLYDSDWNIVGFGDQTLSAAVTPGRYHIVLAPVDEATAYELWAGRCGDYFRAELKQAFLPALVADAGCPRIQDVVTFETRSNRMLSLEWGAEGDPVETKIYHLKGAPRPIWGVTEVQAGHYKIITSQRQSAYLTIQDHGPAESFVADWLRVTVDSMRMSPSPAMVGVVVVEDLAVADGIPHGFGRFGFGGPARYLGDSVSGPYCATVITSLEPSLRDWPFAGRASRRSAPDLLGACWTYGRFGVPGPAITEWLRGGGLLLAESRMQSEPPSALAEEGPLRPRGILGRFPEGSYAALPEACRIGRLEACELAFLGEHEPAEWNARAARETPLVYALSLRSYLYYGLGNSIVADLAADFGEERVAAFWSSDRAVPEAFSSAFGVEIGDWMYDWTVERFGPLPPPRDLGWVEILVSLVFLVLCVGSACVMHGRVEVGGRSWLVEPETLSF